MFVAMLLSLLAMLLSLLALLMTATLLRQRQIADRDAAFARQAHRLHERLTERIRTCDEILKGAAGLHAASEHISRAEWRTYVGALRLDEDHFGMQGLGFAVLVPDKALDQHVASVRSEGFPAYEVSPPGARPEMARSSTSSLFMAATCWPSASTCSPSPCAAKPCSVPETAAKSPTAARCT